jgi:transcription elongation factor/antiterminator RfaH
MNPIDSTNSINPAKPIDKCEVKAEVEVKMSGVMTQKPNNSINPSNSSSSSNSSNPLNRLWYVIHTKPGDEDRVQTNLRNQEIETFLPFLETYQYCGGRMIQKIKPLFPNYLFARLDLELHYYKVKWTRGVSKILGSWNEPVPISGKVVLAIKERLGKDNLVRVEDELKDGDAIQVTSGPFKNLVGIFQKIMTSKGRVRILLSLIGVDVPVQISRWQIKKVA